MTAVSTSAFYDSAIFSMNSLRQQTDQLQAQISTGNKFQTSAQDPVAAAQMRSLQLTDALSTVDTANASSAKTSLTLADSTLSQFTTIVTNIQTLASQAASGTLNDTQRASIGTQIAAYSQNLVDLANAKDATGHALFGGQTAGNAYTLDAQGNATYAGTASANTLSLGSGLTVTTGITGPEFLNFTANGTPGDLLSLVKNLGAALQGNGPAGTTPQAAAQGALDQLNAGLNSITTAQTMVGARLNWISTTQTIQTQLSQQRTATEADVGGTDIATTASRLTQAMTVLQASQASFVKLASLSLFSMLQ